MISRFDSAGNFETILESFRNDKDPRADHVFLLLQQLLKSEMTTMDPQTPKHYYGVNISLQNRENLDSYKVGLLVDSNMQYIKLISIQSDDNNKFEYNMFNSVTDELKANIEKIIRLRG